MRVFCALLFSLLLATSAAAASEQGDVVAEIMSLPFNCSLVNLDWYKRYDTKSIAISLVQRRREYYKRWEKPAIARSRPINRADVDVICFVPSRHIESIIKNGQMNMHQVRHSNCGTPAQLRSQCEDVMIGIHLDTEYGKNPLSAVNFVRPKYGLVQFLKPQGLFVNPNRMMRYGDIMVVYNDQVKRRTTYTLGDSIDQVLGAVAIGKPHEEIRALEDFVRPPTSDPDMYYVEAQIWGALDLSDIKEFRIPAGRDDLVARLKPAGKPIFAYPKQELELIDAPEEISTLKLKEQLLWPGTNDATAVAGKGNSAL